MLENSSDSSSSSLIQCVPCNKTFKYQRALISHLAKSEAHKQNGKVQGDSSDRSRKETTSAVPEPVQDQCLSEDKVNPEEDFFERSAKLREELSLLGCGITEVDNNTDSTLVTPQIEPILKATPIDPIPVTTNKLLMETMGSRRLRGDPQHMEEEEDPDDPDDAIDEDGGDHDEMNEEDVGDPEEDVGESEQGTADDDEINEGDVDDFEEMIEGDGGDPEEMSQQEMLQPEIKVNFDNVELDKLVPTSQIDTFVGDISLGERKVIFTLWKLVKDLIGSSPKIQCPQCKEIFSEQSKLSQHLAISCTQLFEQFFSQAEAYFSKKGAEISSDWIGKDGFSFVKEKIFAFVAGRWCLLCGKTIPVAFNSGDFFFTHVILTHFKKELLSYCKSADLDGKFFACSLTRLDNEAQICGFKFKSQELLLLHIGEQHNMLDTLLMNTSDINTIDGTAPLIENGPFIKCNNCQKCFTNNVSLKIHRANEQRDSIIIKNDSLKIKCGEENCFHTAKFSEEEIIRHFGLSHFGESFVDNSVELNKASNIILDEAKSKDIKKQVVTPVQTKKDPIIPPCETEQDDDIMEISVPKKVYEVIDLDEDDDDDIEPTNANNCPNVKGSIDLDRINLNKVLNSFEVDSSDPDEPPSVENTKNPQPGRTSLSTVPKEHTKFFQKKNPQPGKPIFSTLPHDPRTIGLRKNCIDWGSLNQLQPQIQPSARADYPVSRTLQPVAKAVQPSGFVSSSLIAVYSKMAVDVSCPVCNKRFNLVTSLHHHLATTHFKPKLLSMIKLKQGWATCPEQPCSFRHQMKSVVVDHLANCHLKAFDIAKQKFPEFSVPAPSEVSQQPRLATASRPGVYKMGSIQEDDLQIISEQISAKVAAVGSKRQSESWDKGQQAKRSKTMVGLPNQSEFGKVSSTVQAKSIAVVAPQRISKTNSSISANIASLKNDSPSSSLNAVKKY